MSSEFNEWIKHTLVLLERLTDKHEKLENKVEGMDKNILDLKNKLVHLQTTLDNHDSATATAIKESSQARHEASEVRLLVTEADEDLKEIKEKVEAAEKRLQKQSEWFNFFPKLRQIGMWIITAAAAIKILWDVFESFNK